MENKTYEIEIDGRIIPVTTKEVLDFYPKEYHLTEDDIRQYAAIYTARIKCYREYDGPLDAAYIRRLLDEERLMKTESRTASVCNLISDGMWNFAKRTGRELPRSNMP